MELNLAVGVSFNKERHEYYLRGNKISGVTGRICKHLKIKMPEEFVGEARGEGNHVHNTIESWIKYKKYDSVHPGVLWLLTTLEGEVPEGSFFFSEVLVSDQEEYASAVDIVALKPDGTLSLFDMKRTFKREYVTMQLSIYKYFIEKYTKFKVTELTCAAFTDRMYYPVFARSTRDVEKVLYGG